jgi:hypothetical protein
MSDTKTINAINNHLGDDELKIFKFNGSWYIQITNEWSEVQIPRDSLREALEVMVDHFKTRG